VETTPATCVTEGVITYTCTDASCGETKTEPIAVLSEHTWDEGKETLAATCIAEGETTYTCTVEGCGETKTEAIAKLTEHSWNDGVETVAATCVAEGETTYTCTVEGCGETKTEAIAKLTEHTWDKGVEILAAECEVAGEMLYTCTVEGCGVTDTVEIEPLGHAASEEGETWVVTDGDGACCTVGGTVMAACGNLLASGDVCGEEVEVERLEPTGHICSNYYYEAPTECGNMTEESIEATGNCIFCQGEMSMTVSKDAATGHYFVTDKVHRLIVSDIGMQTECITRKYCVVCGYSEESEEAEIHTTVYNGLYDYCEECNSPVSISAE